MNFQLRSVGTANVFPSKDVTLQLTTLTSAMKTCVAVGTTRRGVLDTEVGNFRLDMHYNLYKESVPNFREQRNNLLHLLKGYNVGVGDIVSTALFHGTTDVAYVGQNGVRILGAGRSAGNGKRAYLWHHYKPLLRASQLAADGIICEPDCGKVPITYSADCVTGVISAPNGAYGVFHSMAKKLANPKDNIIQKMIQAFYELWCIQPEDLEIAFYPSASPSVYEVDEDFAKMFDEKYITREYVKKPHLDLESLAIDLAFGYGVRDIATSDHSTAWGDMESLRGSEHSIMANYEVGNSNGQNIVFAIPKAMLD